MSTEADRLQRVWGEQQKWGFTQQVLSATPAPVSGWERWSLQASLSCHQSPMPLLQNPLKGQLQLPTPFPPTFRPHAPLAEPLKDQLQLPTLPAHLQMPQCLSQTLHIASQENSCPAVYLPDFSKFHPQCSVSETLFLFRAQ